ncbi:hypothetical protein ACFT0E_34745, partial [Streptomyces sp. NPDC057052]
MQRRTFITGGTAAVAAVATAACRPGGDGGSSGTASASRAFSGTADGKIPLRTTSAVAAADWAALD